MANVTTRSRAHLWIAGAAIVWNLIGLAIFIQQATMGPEQLAALSPQDREIHEAMPSWLTMAFAVAVASGVVASIGLWLRQRWAVPTFVVSVLAMVVQFGGVYATTPAWRYNGVGGLIPAIVLVAIQVGFLRYARKAT